MADASVLVAAACAGVDVAELVDLGRRESVWVRLASKATVAIPPANVEPSRRWLLLGALDQRR